MDIEGVTDKQFNKAHAHARALPLLLKPVRSSQMNCGG